MRIMEECQVGVYNPKEKGTKVNILPEGIPLQNRSKRRSKSSRQRVTQMEEEEAEIEDEALEKLREEYSYDNVNQCEELAEEVAPILNGRKFYDEGRLYEIYQVRYDQEFECILGFRRPVSGRTRRDDGAAYQVYGKEGLFELSERYLLENPEEREN